MDWKLAGQAVSQETLQSIDDVSQKQVVDGEAYLIRNGYYIPYFDPHESPDELITRERLNVELCDRIIRESEIRYVSRQIDCADQAIDEMIKQFNSDNKPKQRGAKVVLFQNIVNRIRELSDDYLIEAANRKNQEISDKQEAIKERIRKLYEFVMVEHQDILTCTRRMDGSADLDGTIRELFSEVGKPHAVPLAVIYENRVCKIGRALSAMDRVAHAMIKALEYATDTPKSHIISLVTTYVDAAKKQATIPSSDHFAYNAVSVTCIDARDECVQMLEKMHYLHVSDDERRGFIMFIESGMLLIQDMMNLRDEREMSVKFFEETANKRPELKKAG